MNGLKGRMPAARGLPRRALSTGRSPNTGQREGQESDRGHAVIECGIRTYEAPIPCPHSTSVVLLEKVSILIPTWHGNKLSIRKPPMQEVVKTRIPTRLAYL